MFSNLSFLYKQNLHCFAHLIVFDEYKALIQLIIKKESMIYVWLFDG